MSQPNYITLNGLERIRRELEWLRHEERPRIVAEVSYAASMGDRSENAEYIYGKKRLRKIDSRMRYLRGKVDSVTPVDVDTIVATPHVRFGAIVEVEREDGTVFTWRLVDKDESDVKSGRISMQSPVGSALCGKAEGDVIEVKTPSGPTEYEILAVRYGASEADLFSASCWF